MELKEEILKELKKSEYISGEELAKRLFVSRNSVWKAVKKLREEGYEISAVTNRGYCLKGDNDKISAGAIMRNAARERQPLRRDLEALRLHHFANGCFVVIGLWVARPGTLPQAVVALGIEQPAFIEPGFLETVVDVGRQHKIVFFLHELEQVAVHRLRRVHIAVDVDIPAPIGPMLFKAGKRVEPAGIHVPETIPGDKIRKILLKAFACVGEPGGGGKPGTGPDHDGLRRVQFGFEPCKRITATVCRSHSRCP